MGLSVVVESAPADGRTDALLSPSILLLVRSLFLSLSLSSPFPPRSLSPLFSLQCHGSGSPAAAAFFFNHVASALCGLWLPLCVVHILLFLIPTKWLEQENRVLHNSLLNLWVF